MERKKWLSIFLAVLSMFYVMSIHSVEADFTIDVSSNTQLSKYVEYKFSLMPGKPKAYVLVGDVEVHDGCQKRRAAANDWAADKAKENYVHAEYDVVVKKYATKEDLETACKDPDVKAITIISHGWKKGAGHQRTFAAQMVNGYVNADTIKNWLNGKTLNEVVLHACCSYFVKDSAADCFNVNPLNLKTWRIPILPTMPYYWEIFVHPWIPVTARPDKQFDRTSGIPFLYNGTYTPPSAVPRGVCGLVTYLSPDPTFEFDDDFTLHLSFTISVNSALENATFYASELTEDPAEINAANALPRYMYLTSDLMFIDPSPVTSLWLKIYYTDEEVIERGLNENCLKPYWYNEIAEEYQITDEVSINVDENYVKGKVPNFGIFAIVDDGVPTPRALFRVSANSSGESINGSYVAIFIFAMSASVMVLAFRNNREMSLFDIPATILKQNLRNNLPNNTTNMLQDQMRRQPM